MEIKEYFASPANYTSRQSRKIKYLVYHYTGNINDTAKSNCRYFATGRREASAHYFVDDNDIYRSVPDMSVAWAVGIGSAAGPYIKMPMYKVITNSNSISIEMCGGQFDYEPSEATKRNAIELGKQLMSKYNIPKENIYRHYDVTGKRCPAWLIEHSKWEQFLSMFNEEEEMSYEQFKAYMDTYIQELANKDASVWALNYLRNAEASGVMDDSRPRSYVTREELATVVSRLLDKK